MSHGPAEPPADETVTAEPPGDSRSLLTVVRGEPTTAELAALTVVLDALVSRGSHRPAPDRLAGSRWAAKQQLMRPQLRRGPGAWRASALPH